MTALSNDRICALYKQLEDVEGAYELECAIKQTHVEILEASSFLPDKLVQKYRGLNDYEDLKQIARLTLFKAIKTFNYKRSNNFYAWCYRWIKKEIAVAALKNKIYQESFEFSACPNEDEVANDDPENIIFAKETGSLILEAIEVLDNVSVYTIKKVFGLGTPVASLRKIGDEVHLSHEHVRRVKNAALNSLRHNAKIRTLSYE